MGTASAHSRATAPPTAPDWSASASRDRLSSTLFLAALFHGVVILGVSFGAADDLVAPATSLEVVLVARNDEPAIAPDQAIALAARNLDGAGNTALAHQLHTALQSATPAEAVGPEQAGERFRRIAGNDSSPQPRVVASTASDRPAIVARPSGEPRPSEQQRALPGAQTAVELVNEPDLRTLITAAGPRELVVSARTHASRIADYLSGWKRKVERIGTLNFPWQARARTLQGNPTLEVAIAADGSLREVRVRRSSGERLLDEAAVKILRQAAPFEPFPDFLRHDYDVLRFAYEWRFSAGGASGALLVAKGS